MNDNDEPYDREHESDSEFERAKRRHPSQGERNEARIFYLDDYR